MCEAHTARGVVAEHSLGFAPGLDRVLGRSRALDGGAVVRQVLPTPVDGRRTSIPVAPEVSSPEAVARVETLRSDTKAPVLILLESVLAREPILPVSGQARKQAVKRYRAQALADLADSLRMRSRLPGFADMVNRTPPQAVTIVRDELRRVLGAGYSDNLLPVFMRPGADLRL